MTSQLNHVLNAMDQLVLEVVDSKAGSVKLIGGDSDWVWALFPKLCPQQIFVLTDDTPFLLDFLHDARQIWQGPGDARLRSGFWTEITENNTELHLEAIAIKKEQKNLLVIANQFEAFKLQQHTKQLARELLLSNDRLFLQNEYLHTRLLAIFKQPPEQSTLPATLTKIIENAEFSVIITDSELIPLVENSAARSLFKEDKPFQIQPDKPIDIILKLMKNQLPEYNRILSTKSHWDGELCWMSPPATLKWLKISFYPVKTKLNQVENWIVFANDISTIKYLVQRNEQLALQDMLTELPNRFSFWQTLEKHISSTKDFYLLYVDINNFRRHNEFYGHDEGDKLLIECGKRIESVLKTSDFIARIGGDEFAIILTDIDNRKACEIAIQRIIKHIKKPFTTTKGETFTISISIGAANFPGDAQTAEDLMKFIDLSAYNGKKNNKNSIQFYSQSMRDTSHQLIQLEHELRLAIQNNEFELFLQPIVDLAKNTITKAEALIRWNHPTKGMIAPDNFIPVAEKSDLIIAVGEWVIQRTCQMVKKLAKLGYDIKISMNLSSAQVTDSSLFSYLHNCVQNYKIDPCLLELEVTEGVLVDDYSVANKLLSKVRTIGMSVAVDDFGTGYSSLSYLKQLPLDFLKIDRSFINDIATDDNDKAIVRAVIALAHNLNLCVIAEGVETKEQLNFLTENSCNSVQGYLFSRPVQFKAFIALLQEQQNT
ncbi:putative bifunctional diguanylate cyclase/phosphodiesterase [Thalassomonas haliotis]|uniref:Bifunctional diguanylate cyclase/phosphodiesterase n=1 Tax=Thalassomonas haliotis TaxID=485448 RepID=A0ABY7V7D2_9GAMM|nr:bifunctional diguanylate cyclase/phosphodiesterase [Thalassomonas haliotis]WDE09569.1 bifunctional diguanylate cyclase/phosphodiesterase [Thalassomonas haliotis]